MQVDTHHFPPFKSGGDPFFSLGGISPKDLAFEIQLAKHSCLWHTAQSRCSCKGVGGMLFYPCALVSSAGVCLAFGDGVIYFPSWRWSPLFFPFFAVESFLIPF